MVLQGMNFSVGLCMFRIILLISAGFVLTPKVCMDKVTSQYKIYLFFAAYCA